MYQLIKKEFTLNKIIFAIFAIFPFMFFPLFANTDGGINTFRFQLYFWALMIPFVMMLRESKFNAAITYCSLPFKRRTIVLAKYLSFWVIMISSFLFFMMIGYLLNLFFSHHDFSLINEIFNYAVLRNMVYFSLFTAVVLPIFIRWASFVGVMIGLVLMQILGVVVFILAKSNSIRGVFDFVTGLINNINYQIYEISSAYGWLTFVFMMVLAAFIINFISYNFAVFLFERKEF